MRYGQKLQHKDYEIRVTVVENDGEPTMFRLTVLRDGEIVALATDTERDAS